MSECSVFITLWSHSLKLVELWKPIYATKDLQLKCQLPKCILFGSSGYCDKNQSFYDSNSFLNKWKGGKPKSRSCCGKSCISNPFDLCINTENIGDEKSILKSICHRKLRIIQYSTTKVKEPDSTICRNLVTEVIFVTNEQFEHNIETVLPIFDVQLKNLIPRLWETIKTKEIIKWTLILGRKTRTFGSVTM